MASSEGSLLHNSHMDISKGYKHPSFHSVLINITAHYILQKGGKRNKRIKKKHERKKGNTYKSYIDLSIKVNLKVVRNR
jgi:hypothetical protein